MKRLIRELNSVRADMLRLESEAETGLRGLHETYRDSARNLLHYLALRRRDLRQVQQQLAAMGLSSLGRSEAHVMQNLEAVLGALHSLAGSDGRALLNLSGSSVGFAEGQRLLEEHARELLGRAPGRRRVRIMVTMPSKAADDYELVRDLVAQGMGCMRINCAHDDPAAWLRMIDNLRRAKKETRKGCRVLMDLPGPKLRTGPIEPGPQVVSWSPRRDHVGRVEAIVRVWLARDGAEPPEQADAYLPVPGDWLANVRKGSRIDFVDACGGSRSLKVVEAAGEGAWAESNQTTYVNSGTTLRLVGHAAKKGGVGKEGKVGTLPPVEQWIRLRVGDSLTLRLDERPGSPAVYDREARLVRAASVGVTLPEAFAHVREGESIWFDDGKIGGRLKSVGAGEVEVEITHAGPDGEKLRGDKGINLPESRLRLPSLTEDDLEALPFIARHADLVGYSFVRTASDVRALQKRLKGLGGEGVGLVLKIETGRALRELPNIILAAMRSPAAGVMIARGDLAVECGWERLAEVQEELLWVCEAAHVPVIWATQVLESLAKEGTPSRAEVTDAAMGARAECVMLNKGDYIVEAVGALDGILRRMQSHQRKKRPMLRPLKLADQFEADGVLRDKSPKLSRKRRAATGRVRKARKS